jgi:hypothetical protein
MAIEAMGVSRATPMGQILGTFLLVTVTLYFFFFFWFETTTKYQIYKNKKSKQQQKQRNNITKWATTRTRQTNGLCHQELNSKDKFEFLTFNHQNTMNLNSWHVTIKRR